MQSQTELQPVDYAGIVLSITLFIALVIPFIPIYLKKLYYKIHHVTLDAQRRLTLSIFEGFLFSIPSILFASHEIWYSGSSRIEAFRTFCKRILPLAAYCFVPILFAYIRPLAAVPLDLWDFLIILALVVPILVQICLGEVDFLFNHFYKSPNLWFDFHSLYIIAGSMVIFVYSVLRPLPDTGLGREMRLPTLWDCFLTIICTGLLLASLPLLVFTDHVFDKITNIQPLWFFVNFICIFFFLALPLELIFRGVIQNLFHARVEVYQDIRNFTSDTDTQAKLDDYDRNSRFFPESSLASYLNLNDATAVNIGQNGAMELSSLSSYHQRQQTEDLLELSLQLGAPAAQKPLSPGTEHNTTNGDYKSFGSNKNDPKSKKNSLNKGNKNVDNSHESYQIGTISDRLARKDDAYRGLLVDSTQDGSNDDNLFQLKKNQNNLLSSTSSRNSKDRSNSSGDALVDVMDSVIRPQPLQFPSKKSQGKNDDKYRLDHANGDSFGPNMDHSGHNGTSYQNFDELRPYQNKNSPYFGSTAEKSMISTVGSGGPRSVVYSVQNVTNTNGVTGANIKDATSRSLGAGFVSNNDAVLSALNIQNDLVNENSRMGTINNGPHDHHGEIDDNDSLYSPNPAATDRNEYYYDNATQSYRKNPNHSTFSSGTSSSSSSSSSRYPLMTRFTHNIDNVPFDANLHKARQHGYTAQAFEHSPKWPTWQQRHSNFYSRSLLHWFLLPSKIDYVVTVFASLLYAGIMLYNVVTYIQTAQSDGTQHHDIKSYTWVTLFIVLTWQGVLSGFLWRMSSQIWPSVAITAIFFTLSAYWLGLDG